MEPGSSRGRRSHEAGEGLTVQASRGQNKKPSKGGLPNLLREGIVRARSDRERTEKGLAEGLARMEVEDRSCDRETWEKFSSDTGWR